MTKPIFAATAALLLASASPAQVDPGSDWRAILNGTGGLQLAQPLTVTGTVAASAVTSTESIVAGNFSINAGNALTSSIDMLLKSGATNPFYFYQNGVGTLLKLAAISGTGTANALITASSSAAPFVYYGVEGSASNITLVLVAKGSGTIALYGPLKLLSYTVATLPTCNVALQDTIVAVTDVVNPTYRGALTGGGSIRTPAYCDSATWTAH